MFSARTNPLPVLAGVIAAAVFLLLHARGIHVTTDGWFYWQGAVSLVEGKGYTDFGDLAILYWPPLYSVYLAPWMAALGATGLGLVAANTALMAAQAALWTGFALDAWRDSEGSFSKVQGSLIALYLGLFVPLNQQHVLAHALDYALLPLWLWAVWRLSRSAGSLGRYAIIATVLGIALVLTHNRAVVFLVAGSALVMLSTRHVSRSRRLLTAVGMTGIPFAVWLGVRAYLGQTGSHPMGVEILPASDYAWQLLAGIGTLVVPPKRGVLVALVSGLVLLAGLLYQRRRWGSLEFVTSFIAIATVGFFALFNVFWTNAPLSGRFILYVPMLLVPAMALSLWRIRPLPSHVLWVALLLPLVFRVGMAARLRTTESLEAMGFPMNYVGLTTRIDRKYLTGPPILERNGTILIPPAKRRHQDGRLILANVPND